MTQLPEYFLGKSIEEAEEIHKEYMKLLNKVAREYSLCTGLDKKDLVSESLFALAEAKVTFDSEKGESFKQFVFFKVKDRLNEYVRENSCSVKIPKYMERTIRLVNRIEKMLTEIGYEDIEGALINQNVCCNLRQVQKELDQQFDYLNNYAERANITTEKLVKRTRFIPTNVQAVFGFEKEPAVDNNIEKKILVKEMFKHMSKQEQMVCVGIMSDKTYAEIAGKLKIPESKVKTTVRQLRKRFKTLFKD